MRRRLGNSHKSSPAVSCRTIQPLFLDFRVGNMLFSVETQTTEERTQQYQSEVESIYKDLTAKGKALMLSTELGVRANRCVIPVDFMEKSKHSQGNCSWE